MLLRQDTPPFRPVTFILETESEANALWDIVNAVETTSADPKVRELCIEVSNWFTNNYHS